jgi:Uma2 family endonuclease
MSTPPVHRTFAEQHAFNCQAVAQLWTEPRYAEAPEVIETDRDGNPIMSPPPEWCHDLRKNRIAKLLERLMAEGEAFVETAVSTFQGAKVPDASWFGHQRLQERLNASPEEAIPAVAPEVCVEVRSPGNTETEIEEKKSAYFEVGVREVWVCDEAGNMTFHGPQGPMERSVICSEFPRHVPA